MIRKVAFTVYPVRDMDRARRFYEQGLGLQVSDQYEGMWIEYEAGGGVLALTNTPELGRPAADAGGTIAFEVDDVDALTARLREQGATVLSEPMATPVCRMSVVADPEGNAVILHRVND
ncbi:MAG: VOC family protein [Acidobacteria bacterium]|nr:VOC family protein [Acidobacteriota bacterium]